MSWFFYSLLFNIDCIIFGVDGENHKIVDIVEDRKLNNLINYFSRYTIETRNNVEHILIDMYSPYISLIKEIFPKAKISMDRFHLVQLINRAFNKNYEGLFL